MRAVQFTLFALCFASYQAYASLDLNMPAGVTPVSREIYNLHMTVLGVCVIIGIIVFGTITYSIINHRKSKGAEPERFHEHFWLEITWTAIPFLILVGLAIPGTLVLINMNDEAKSDLTIKITGFQWKWKYEYLENGISFFSNLSTPFDELNGNKPKNPNYLREVDKPLVVPVHKKIRFLITSNDVVHAWWVPELGVKKDAVPGFINETWARINRPGTYRGQCVELCGMNHAFMPIVVIAKSEKGFNDWVTQQGGKPTIPPAAPSTTQTNMPSTTSPTSGTVSTNTPPVNKTTPEQPKQQVQITPPSGQPPQQAPVTAAAVPTPAENATTQNPAVQAAEAAAQAAEATAEAAEAVSKHSPATQAAEAAAKAAEATARAAEIGGSAALSAPPAVSNVQATATTGAATTKKPSTQKTEPSVPGPATNVSKSTPSAPTAPAAAPTAAPAVTSTAPTAAATPATTSATPAAPVAAPTTSTPPSNITSQTAVAPSAAPTKTMAELMQHGKEVFEGTCAACHKPDGTGMPPVYPSLKGSKIATGPLPAHLNRVLNGKPGTAMQAFRDQFSDDDLAAVITYERNSFGNSTGDAVQPSQIEAAKKLPPTGQ